MVRGKGRGERVRRIKEGGGETMVRGEGGGEKAQISQHAKLLCVCEPYKPRLAGQRPQTLCL